MAQTTTGWKSVFSVPTIYRLAQRGIGSPNVRRVTVDEFMRCEPGDRVLDIGCGTGDLSPLLASCEYVGFDLSPSYIEAAQAKYGDIGQFSVGTVGDGNVAIDPFDCAVAKGVLHHLDDHEAHELFATAHAALRPGARLVTIDPAYVEGQAVVAKKLIDRDRGRNVRTPAEYEALARSTFADVEVTVRHDLLNVPYTHVILSCTRQ